MHSKAMIFGGNVKKLREEHKLSKKEMAKIMGVGTKTLTSIESGVIPPRARADIILKLCDRFCINAQELLNV